MSVNKILKKSELLSKEVSMENILYKLFHSLDVRVLKEIKVTDKCRCSLDRVKNTLSNIQCTFKKGRK